MIDITKRAHDFLKKLQPKEFKQVGNKIFSLIRNPYPNDCRHLSGYTDYRRVDIGEFRICYTLSNKIICIVLVGKRNDDSVYKKLRRIT